MGFSLFRFYSVLELNISLGGSEFFNFYSEIFSLLPDLFLSSSFNNSFSSSSYYTLFITPG